MKDTLSIYEEMSAEEVAKRLRVQLAITGMSTSEFADLSSINAGSVGRYLRKENPLKPKTSTLTKMLNALGVGMEEFLLDAAPQKKPIENNDLDFETQELLELWGKIPEEKRKELLAVLRWAKPHLGEE